MGLIKTLLAQNIDWQKKRKLLINYLSCFAFRSIGNLLVDYDEEEDGKWER